MNKLRNTAGLIIGLLALGAVSYVISGWEDPFFRPMDILKSSVKSSSGIVQLTYPDEITIDRDFANILIQHKRSAKNSKIKQFTGHLIKNGEYVIKPRNNDVFRAVVVKNEGKGVLSFSVYIKAIVDSRPSEVLYRMSGYIEQFPNGPITVERAEKNTRQKIDVPLEFYYKNEVSLWDFSVYAALEAGPCCN